jgi:hypothetical protein
MSIDGFRPECGTEHPCGRRGRGRQSGGRVGAVASTDRKVLLGEVRPVFKHRPSPMRGLQTDRTAQTIIAGHAFMQNPRRSHYELGLNAPRGLRVAAAFTELAVAI